MSGKHRYWHHAWRRDEAGLVVHISGLRVQISEDDDGSIDAVTEDGSIAVWEAFERGRGVPEHDLQGRLLRLLREAAQWHERNP